MFLDISSPATSALDTKKTGASAKTIELDSITKREKNSTESFVRVSDEEVKRIASNSKEFLSHLSALNKQFFEWIDQHIKKNPYILISPCIRDYEKHLAELAKEYANKEDESTDVNKSSPKNDVKQDTALTSSDKPPPAKGLLSGIFGNPTSTAATTTTANFSFGSSQPFTFGQEKKADTTGTKESTTVATSGFSFGSSTTGASTPGFTFGATTGTSSPFNSG